MTQVRVNGRLIRCTIARTPSELALGLQRHASLEADEGMLFLFPFPRTATFHMGEVAFPIDIVGIDEDSRITRIVEGARPKSLERWYFSRVAAVLELAGGTCRRLALKVGDTCDIVEHDNIRLAQYSSIVYHGSNQPGLDYIQANTPTYEGGIGSGVYVAFDPDVAAYYGKYIYQLRLLLSPDDIFYLTPDTIDPILSDYLGDSILVGESILPFSFELKGQRYSVVTGHGGVDNDQEYVDQVTRSYLVQTLDDSASDIVRWLRSYIRTGSLDVDAIEEAFIYDLSERSPQLTDIELDRAGATFRQWAKVMLRDASARASRILGLCISLDEIGNEVQSFGYKGVYLSGVRGHGGPDEELLVFDPDNLELIGEVTHDKELTSQASLLEIEDLNDPIEDHEPHKSTEPSGKVYDQPKEQYFRDLWGDILADEALDVRPELQTRVSRARRPRTAQIVDEARFVEKVAPILFAHANKIPWEKDTLNGGATERAVVTRAELAQWLSGGPTESLGETGADKQSIEYILSAAGNERGLRLLGTAFVLAELADFTRLGFSRKQPILVLYRESATT